MKKHVSLAAFCVLFSFLVSCGSPGGSNTPPGKPTLAETRASFENILTKHWRDGYPVDTPPEGDLIVVEYDSPAGRLAAYVSPDPGDGVRHPAIVWVAGGFSASIGDTFWTATDHDNYQSAANFRASGIVTMYPSLRGGNENPGYQEYFLGEVDDVIAAARYLASLPYVDPDRIYLGGHSTGGTLALLVAESTVVFRAVFSFGPTNLVSHYGSDQPYDIRNSDEVSVRSPINWLECVTSRTFVIEGGSQPGNRSSLLSLQNKSLNPYISFCDVEGYDHFTVLYPGCMVIAERILSDTGPQCGIELNSGDIIEYGKGHESFIVPFLKKTVTFFVRCETRLP